MRKILKSLLVLTASALLWAGQANALLIDIGEVTEDADAGTVTMDIVATDLGDDVIVAYDMDFLFSGFTDASVEFFEVLGSSDFFEALYGGSPLDPMGIVGDILQNVGGLSLLFDAADLAYLAGLQSGDPLVLFTITWEWDGISEYDVSFIWDVENGQDVKCWPGEVDDVCFPVSVPEPGTLGLLGLGLLGLGLARRRRML